MSRLDIYRIALLAADPAVSGEKLCEVLESEGPGFPGFVVAHGLGPMWHGRTGRDEIRQSRMQAEALYLAQEKSLRDVGAALDDAGIEYVVMKGAANRLLVYENPAIRACYDLDLLVRPEDRVAASGVLMGEGFEAHPKAANISIELLLTRSEAQVDLHWRLLRDGRLKNEDIGGMLQRRRKVAGQWMLDADDALFLLLVHPAFMKYLASWEMGLHRVADILRWLQTQQNDWNNLQARFEENGVRTAAWATLYWVQLLTCGSAFQPRFKARLEELISNLQPGRLRRAWLDRWLRYDLPARTANLHKARLLLFSLILHDDVKGTWRALAGRHRAHRRRDIDLAAFRDLVL